MKTANAQFGKRRDKLIQRLIDGLTKRVTKKTVHYLEGSQWEGLSKKELDEKLKDALDADQYKSYLEAITKQFHVKKECMRKSKGTKGRPNAVDVNKLFNCMFNCCSMGFQLKPNGFFKVFPMEFQWIPNDYSSNPMRICWDKIQHGVDFRGIT